MPRPDLLTVHEDDERLDIVVPPAARRHQLGVVFAIGPGGILVLADLIYHTQGLLVFSRVDHIFRIVFDCIMLGTIVLIGQRAYLNLTLWTRLNVQESRLVIQQYRRAIRIHMQWTRHEIMHVSAVRAPRRWNLRRPTLLQIELVGRSTVDVLHEQPLVDLERIESLLRERLLR